MDLKLKVVKGRGYDPYKRKEVKRAKRRGKSRRGNGGGGRGAPVPLATHVNNSLHSIFSNVEVHINYQQIYNSNGLYAHNSYISNNFKGAIFEHEGALQCKEYDYEEIPDEIMEAPLSEPFFYKNENAY